MLLCHLFLLCLGWEEQFLTQTDSGPQRSSSIIVVPPITSIPYHDSESDLECIFLQVLSGNFILIPSLNFSFSYGCMVLVSEKYKSYPADPGVAYLIFMLYFLLV